jgi:acetyl-CoA/propionyl-CoA carboxylase biotin carboxyl carrier protein
VLAGDARTDTLDRIWPPDDWAERVAIPDDAWAAAAARLVTGVDPSDPWAGGWRLNAPLSVTIEADGETRWVEVPPAPAPASGSAQSVEAVRVGEIVHLDLAGRSTAFRIAPPPDVDAAARAAVAHHSVGATGPAEVVAPMPGAVVRVHGAVGQVVALGDPIVTLEAMKMEHAVAAPMPGRIADVRVRPADQVSRGQLLAVIEP